jgi:hypothetical protein
MTRFVLNTPRHSLAKVYGLLSDMACLKTPLANALMGLKEISSPLVRRLGEEILPAFDIYNRERNFDGIGTLAEFTASYPLGRGVFVPVKPTFVLVESDGLTPVFVIGWASLPFDDFQKRLLSTIIYEAVLTLTDFVGRDAEIICFPRAPFSKRDRTHRAWKVSDYKRFDQAEMTALLGRYGDALDLAAGMIRKILGESV